MNDEQQDQLRDIHASKGRGGGPRQEIGRDPRVSAAAAWFMNLLQGLVVIALAFVANNLYQINLTLAADAVTKQEMARQISETRAMIDKNDARDDRQEEHISSVDGRVYTLEGHNLRGGPVLGN